MPRERCSARSVLPQLQTPDCTFYERDNTLCTMYDYVLLAESFEDLPMMGVIPALRYDWLSYYESKLALRKVLAEPPSSRFPFPRCSCQEVAPTKGLRIASKTNFQWLGHNIHHTMQ